MAAHSSVPAWEIPWTEEAGGLQSVGARKSRTRQGQSSRPARRVTPSNSYFLDGYSVYCNNFVSA